MNKITDAVKSDQKDEETNTIILSIADFLESHPPNQAARISNIQVNYSQLNYRGLYTPELQLHCSNEACNGTRFFRCITSPPKLIEGTWQLVYVTYRCSNCQKTEKIFSLYVRWDHHDSDYLPTGDAIKIGEIPPFGPPTSSKLIKLIGPDRDLFLKGRRCENQGLGIGAFVYYRRVVENQRTRILSQIARVAEKMGAPEEKIKIFEKAKNETQFSRSMEVAKSALPESLLIDGHNPLALLHSALSEGVHDLADDRCLEVAGSIRVVLVELSERISQALKDEAELKSALSTLLKIKNGS